MPEYLAPGVFVEEIELGGKPIEGVSTSTAAFIGETERGPTKPRLVTGMGTYRRLFGDNSWTSGKAESKSFLPYAADGFFANGGKRCFISRVTGKGSKVASLQLGGESETSAEESPEEPAEEEGRGAKRRRSGRQVAARPIIGVSAVGAGAWGNRVGVTVGPGSSSGNVFKLRVYYWRQPPPTPVVDPADPSRQKDPNRRAAAVVEEFDSLSADAASPDFYQRRINGQSALIEVEQLASGNPPVTSDVRMLEGGDDGSELVLESYVGAASAGPGQRTGLDALREIDEISMVCVHQRAGRRRIE